MLVDLQSKKRGALVRIGHVELIYRCPSAQGETETAL